MAKGMIFDIREFTVHDGPGFRVTVFFKGCPLRCVWCHNPEGISFQPEVMKRYSLCTGCGKCRKPCTHAECKTFGLCTKICPNGLISIAGEMLESEELISRIKRYANFPGLDQGGITVSGGEPLAQPEFLLELLEGLKPFHTAVETSGYCKNDLFRRVMDSTDLILFDIKHTDPIIHQRITGVSNEMILKNLACLIHSGRDFIARVPLIPGINDSEENMANTAALLKNAPGLKRVELLPYNPFTGAKYQMTSKSYKPCFDENRKVKIYKDVFERYNISSIVL